MEQELMVFTLLLGMVDRRRLSLTALMDISQNVAREIPGSMEPFWVRDEGFGWNDLFVK